MPNVSRKTLTYTVRALGQRTYCSITGMSSMDVLTIENGGCVATVRDQFHKVVKQFPRFSNPADAHKAAQQYIQGVKS